MGKTIVADKDPPFDPQSIAPRRTVLLYVVISVLFITIFPLEFPWLRRKHFSLFLNRIFLRIGTLLDGTIPGFPQKPVGLSLLVQLRLVVRDSLLSAFQRAFQKKRKKEKQAITSPLSPLNNSSHSSVQPPLQKPHLNKQTPRCSEIIMQPTVSCLFTWTPDHGSPDAATISTLRQTEPGSNQAISTACCHSLSSSFHNSHIRFPFYRDWYDKTHNGRDRHQKMQRQVNVIYLTFTLNREEERRDEVPSEVLF